MIVFLLLCIVLLLSTSIFLGKELLKKFRFWKAFRHTFPHQTSWIYGGVGTPGMYTVSMQSVRPFRALIGFEFSLGPWKNIGFDVFGAIISDDTGYAEIDLYLGDGGVEFLFLLDADVSISFDVSPMKQK